MAVDRILSTASPALRTWRSRPWRFHTPNRNRTLRTLPSCAVSCDCAATPSMPDGLEIDHKAPISGLLSSYNEQILICTGKNDWSSRIDDDNSGDNLAADLKELFGRGGLYADPFHTVSVLNSSFPPSTPRLPNLVNSSAYLFPTFKYIPFLPRVSFEGVEALAKGYLLPEKLHSAHDVLSPLDRDRLTRQPAYQHLLPGVRDVHDILVLICGHGGRDMRCGVMGPVLKAEFERELPRQGVTVLHGPSSTDAEIQSSIKGPESEMSSLTARVGQVSHIGGHKFAGNVIIYLPPSLCDGAGKLHPLAGHSIWYGRIEPKHVRGIVEATVVEGAVVVDKLRGGIRRDGTMLRL